MPEINPEALEKFRGVRPDETLGGVALGVEKKVMPVDNGISKIRFFERDVLSDTVSPYLRAEPSSVEDPAPQIGLFAVGEENEENEENERVAAFSERVKAAIAAHRPYLNPAEGSIAGVHTRYQLNAITGQRIARCTDELLAAVEEQFPAGQAGRDDALYAVHTSIFDLYSRELRFDEAETNGYASFGKDAAFVHAWELRLSELRKVDARLLSPPELDALRREEAQLQAELDAIFRDKYVYNSDRMFEVNAEVSIGLCLIDVQTRQRVSEIAATQTSLVPAYELLSLGVEGAARAVYYDALEETYYYDGSDEIVDSVRVSEIQRTPLAAGASLTFRRAASGEHLRKNFRFDWNRDGYVAKAKIDWVSWAGHCNDKSNLEAHGVVVPAGDPGVHEYDSAAGSTAHYTRDLLNEFLLSLSELGSRMVDSGSGRRTSLSKDEFAGARDDDRPDRIVLGPKLTIPLRDRPNKLEITKIEADGRTYSADEIFRPKLIAEDGRSAADNPLYVGTEEGDRVTLDLSAAIVHLALELQIFDSSGYPTTLRREVVLNFAEPPEEPVFVDTVLKDAGAREIYEVSLDLGGQRWLAQLVRMEAAPEGRSYRAVDVGEPIVRTFDAAALRGQREVSLDDPSLYMPFIKEALQTGRNFTSETADGAGVWNGRTKHLVQATQWRDDASRWAKISLAVEARYGGNQGAFLVKHRPDGKPDYYVPLALPFDFAWRTDVAFAPICGEQINVKARDRGVISDLGGRFTTEAITGIMELVCAAFGEHRYLIRHRGQRYIFADRSAWEGACAQLETLRQRALGIEAQPAAAVSTAVLEVSASVERKSFVQYEIVVEAAGDVKIILDSKLGDADLYVRVGGTATPVDGGYTLLSDKFGLERDVIEIPSVSAGTTIGIAVHGYKGSDFELVVWSPRPGRPSPSQPESVDRTMTGVVLGGGSDAMEPITIEVDGTLDVQLAGSGDADVFVGLGGPATRREYDWRLHGLTTNERGRLSVRRGDQVHVMVSGFGARSEYTLRVRSV